MLGVVTGAAPGVVTSGVEPADAPQPRHDREDEPRGQVVEVEQQHNQGDHEERREREPAHPSERPGPTPV